MLLSSIMPLQMPEPPTYPDWWGDGSEHSFCSLPSQRLDTSSLRLRSLPEGLFQAKSPLASGVSAAVQGVDSVGSLVHSAPGVDTGSSNHLHSVRTLEGASPMQIPGRADAGSRSLQPAALQPASPHCKLEGASLSAPVSAVGVASTSGTQIATTAPTVRDPGGFY